MVSGSAYFRMNTRWAPGLPAGAGDWLSGGFCGCPVSCRVRAAVRTKLRVISSILSQDPGSNWIFVSVLRKGNFPLCTEVNESRARSEGLGGVSTSPQHWDEVVPRPRLDR